MRNPILILGIMASTAVVYALAGVQDERIHTAAQVAAVGPTVDVVLVSGWEGFGIPAELVTVARVDLPGEPVGTVQATAEPVQRITAHSSGGLPG
jgi:hypothetical protein